MKVDISILLFQQADFSGKIGLEAYVRQAKDLGLFETGESCDTLAPVLILVTCPYEWDCARNVLIAVRKAECHCV